jgi:GxxExxY protein
VSKLIFEDETYAIRGAAIEVHRHLGYGFLEAVYQEALEIELQQRGIPFASHKPLTVTYKGIELKKRYAPDIICYGKVIVEIKCISNIGSSDRAQLLNYLKATGIRVGLVVNFGSKTKLQVERMVF